MRYDFLLLYSMLTWNLGTFGCYFGDHFWYSSSFLSPKRKFLETKGDCLVSKKLDDCEYGWTVIWGLLVLWKCFAVDTKKASPYLINAKVTNLLMVALFDCLFFHSHICLLHVSRYSSLMRYLLRVTVVSYKPYPRRRWISNTEWKENDKNKYFQICEIVNFSTFS